MPGEALPSEYLQITFPEAGQACVLHEVGGWGASSLTVGHSSDGLKVGKSGGP